MNDAIPVSNAAGTVPTDQTTVTAEGSTLADAIRIAADQLGVPAALVNHKIDLEHFRSERGLSVGSDTVRIVAWARDPADYQGALAAQKWLEGLIERLGVEARVQATVDGARRARIRIDSPDARHLVGRGGATLNAIHTLLEAALSKANPGWSWTIDVSGPEDAGGRSKPERRGRDARRGGDRRRPNDRHRSDERRSERDLQQLRKLARRLAREAIKTGRPVTLRKKLNSFERREVHLVIASIDGVRSTSAGKGTLKRVRIVPERGLAEE